MASVRHRLGEFIAVFLGVVLAFLADDFRERLGDVRTEQAALVGLRTDFARNARQLSAEIARNRRLTRGAAELRRILSAAHGSVVAVPDTLLMTVAVGSGTYDPIRGTVDALMSSGELRLIGNAELRSAVAEWPAAVADVTENQRWARQAVENFALSGLIETGVSLERIIENYPAWIRQELPAEAAVWVTTVRSTPRLRTLVALRRDRLSVATGFLERLAGLEGRILQLLDEQP